MKIHTYVILGQVKGLDHYKDREIKVEAFSARDAIDMFVVNHPGLEPKQIRVEPDVIQSRDM